ncbi:hypothetical protein E2542_SST27452 [Spatholobus suberectus]|nr:hypothetical protein E2542_SST27452 [Spatholobus suberectus]
MMTTRAKLEHNGDDNSLLQQLMTMKEENKVVIGRAWAIPLLVRLLEGGVAQEERGVNYVVLVMLNEGEKGKDNEGRDYESVGGVDDRFGVEHGG